jgi:hypothetical protein
MTTSSTVVALPEATPLPIPLVDLGAQYVPAYPGSTPEIRQTVGARIAAVIGGGR